MVKRYKHRVSDSDKAKLIADSKRSQMNMKGQLSAKQAKEGWTVNKYGKVESPKEKIKEEVPQEVKVKEQPKETKLLSGENHRANLGINEEEFQGMNVWEKIKATSPFKTTGTAGQVIGTGLEAAGSLGSVPGKIASVQKGIQEAEAIKKAETALNLKEYNKFAKEFPVTLQELDELGKGVIKTKKARGGTGKGILGLGALYGINEVVLSPSELSTWAAIDNIAGQAAFLTRDIADAVKYNGMSPIEAEKRFARAEESIKNAKKFVNRTTMFNPKLWANRKILMQTLREAEARLEFSRQSVSGFGEEQQTI